MFGPDSGVELLIIPGAMFAIAAVVAGMFLTI